jgi:YbbR domain-containing protein
MAMAWNPFRHFWLKIAAIGLGTVLWITVSGQQVERSVVVQLQFRNVPVALEITGDTPHTIDVRLRGASGQFSQLAPSDVVATIDLTDARPGVRVFPLTADHISVPLGIEVKSVDPATISLNLEKSASTAVMVNPTIDGDPAPGYEVDEIISDPKTVVVVGPESRIKAVPSAVTERISIEGATRTVTETVSMGASDSAVRLSHPQSARVTIKIVSAPPTRFSGRPITFLNLMPGRTATADPPTVTVSVRARPDQLSVLRDHDLAPYVDLAGLGPGHYTLPVHVDAHGEYVIGAVEPSPVSVRIR